MTNREYHPVLEPCENPPEVIQQNLKQEKFLLKRMREEYASSNDAINEMCSFCHADQIVEVQRRGNPLQKPKLILDYNSGKSSIDISDQMASYSTALRKSIRCYKNLATEIIFGISMGHSGHSTGARFLNSCETLRTRKVANEFMKRNPKLNTGKFTKEYTFKDSHKLWAEISAILNAVPTVGTNIGSSGERLVSLYLHKCFIQMNINIVCGMWSKAKAKKSTIIKSRNRTGAGMQSSDNLDVLEENILELLNPMTVKGLPNVAEAFIQLHLELVQCNEDQESDLRNKKEVTEDDTQTDFTIIL
ncbi:hypothetical protein CBL_20381 [Carabus blaptoides fortunei]